jgi:hypothetical protein
MRPTPLACWTQSFDPSSATSFTFLSPCSLCSLPSSNSGLPTPRRRHFRPRISFLTATAALPSPAAQFIQDQINRPDSSSPASDSVQSAVRKATYALLLALQHDRRTRSKASDADVHDAARAFLAIVKPWSLASERQFAALELHWNVTMTSCKFFAAYATLKRPLQLFALRTLQRTHAELKLAAAAARAVDGDPVIQRAALKDKRRLLSRTSEQYARVHGRIGTQPNVYWRAVDREVLRAHMSWENLPLAGALSIQTARDLRYLRQDCEAWFAARSLVQVNASTVWMALGFGEQGTARRLGLSTASGMRSHCHALQAYKQMSGPAPYAALRKAQDERDEVKQVYFQFGSLHEASALLSYIGWENGVFSNSAAELRRSQGRLPEGVFSEMVRIQEAGLYILEDEDVPVEYGIDCADVPVVAASPDGIVRRRRSDDFGAWEVHGTEVVEIKCRVPFVPLGGNKDGIKWGDDVEMEEPAADCAKSYADPDVDTCAAERDATSEPTLGKRGAWRREEQSWLFRLIGPSLTVSANHYAQVQFQMLCVGRHVRRAQLASYAVMNGLAVIEVERNDAWLAMALRVLGDFQRDFANTGMPPPEDFYFEKPEYAAFVELTRDSMHAAEKAATYVVPVDEVEACLLPQDDYQQRMHDKWRRDVFVRDGRQIDR